MIVPDGRTPPADLVDPPLDYPPYRASQKRHPKEPLVILPSTLSELTGPVFGPGAVRPTDGDLTRQHAGEPIGERIVLEGRVLDDGGRAVTGALVEVWQANSAGRYAHKEDRHGAPLDPNFTGAGRALTDAAGRYRFETIRPGAYPWLNHPNAWRPSHIHFSLFGLGLVQRLVTQMYFPGDPLLALDPIFQSVPGERAQSRLVARFDLGLTEPERALGFRFDIVLRGRAATPMTG
ncbi:MAG: protocatechuate 3,4-dioxygenase subunit beta [Gemmatimonadetes bacterium]|nr:protocatechuate 3,4-dioxygenase subunit beta [Gemmatimonadota bacterium]